MIEGQTAENAEVIEEAPRPTDALVEFGRDEIGLDRARAIANRLDDIIRKKQLAVRIGKNDHIRVEAWCALASMTGLTPRTVWTKDVRGPNGEFEGAKARVEVIRLATDQIIGAAEASCFADEVQRKREGTYVHRWVDACPCHPRPPTGPCDFPPTRHAVESMAQTRATSKAIGQDLRWIPVLAGYSGTPAEEMPRDEYEAPPRDEDPHRSDRPSSSYGSAPKEDKAPTERQIKLLRGVSYDRAKGLLILQYGDKPFEDDEKWRIAGRIRARALEFLGLNTDTLRMIHVDSFKAAIERAELDDEGNPYIPTDEPEEM